LVYRKLSYFGLDRDAGRADCRPDSLAREGIELSTRLPNVDYAPAIVGRTRCGEDEPVWVVAAYVDSGVEPIEFLNVHTRQLDTKSDGHDSPLIGSTRVYVACG